MKVADEKELEARLKAKTPQGWYGLAVGPGWYDLVDACDRALTMVAPDYKVLQIKEKFGGLRYYITDVPPDALELTQGIITAAEELASHTCEECGQPGTLRSEFWYRTQCDEHDAEYIKRREAREADYT